MRRLLLLLLLPRRMGRAIGDAFRVALCWWKHPDVHFRGYPGVMANFPEKEEKTGTLQDSTKGKLDPWQLLRQPMLGSH